MGGKVSARWWYEALNPPEELRIPGDAWQGLYEALLSPAYGRFAKYHLHREHVGELCQRPEKVEEGRDASDRVAEDPYRFFSRAPWRVAKRERVREEGSCNGEVKGGRF